MFLSPFPHRQAVEKTRKTRVVEPQMVNEEGDAIHSTASAPPMEQASHFTSNMRALPAEILSPEHESHAQSSSFPPTRIPASQVPESKTNFPSPSHFSSPQCHASTVPVNTSVTASAPRPHPPPMGFAETVKLVATCTAAATAAALASQRVRCSSLHPNLSTALGLLAWWFLTSAWVPHSA